MTGLQSGAAAQGGYQAAGGASYFAAPASFAHPAWLSRMSPAIASPQAFDRLIGSRRAAPRLNALLKRRFDLDAISELDFEIDGRKFLLCDAATLERRLLFVGAVSAGPALRLAVSKLAVTALVEVLGEAHLRAAMRAATLGREERALDTSSAHAVRRRFAAAASRHFAAWLARQSEPVRKRAFLALAPDGDLSPRNPREGDPELIPTLAPLFRHLEAAAA